LLILIIMGGCNSGVTTEVELVENKNLNISRLIEENNNLKKQIEELQNKSERGIEFVLKEVPTIPKDLMNEFLVNQLSVEEALTIHFKHKGKNYVLLKAENYSRKSEMVLSGVKLMDETLTIYYKEVNLNQLRSKAKDYSLYELNYPFEKIIFENRLEY